MPQFLHHHLNWHHVHYTEMGELYVSLMLRSLAIGVGGLFVPIYLFELGYPLLFIAAFFLLAAVIRFPLEIMNGFLIARFGAKHILSGSYIMAMLYFLALYAIPAWNGWWLIASVLLALEMSWFWSSYNVHSGHSRSRNHGAQQIGKLLILKRVAAAAGPFIGGVIAAAFGVEYSLLLAAALLLGAIHPLLRTEDYYDRHEFHFRLLPIFRTGVAYIGYQFNSFAGVYLWPLFMFLALGTYDDIGFILSITAVIMSLLAIYAGKLTDKGKDSILLSGGTILAAIANLGRAWASGFGQFFGVNLASDIASNFLVVSFTEDLHRQADNNERLNYIVNLQIWAAIAKTAMWALVLVLATSLAIAATLQVAFVVSAGVTMMIPLMIHQD